MNIDGSCHCGKVSFRAKINPNNVLACHCSDCQLMSGGPYRTVVPAREENFELQGETRTYVKVADSGNQRTSVFCPVCGTPIYGSTLGDDPKVIGIRGGVVNQRTDLPPKRQIWCASAMPWLEAVLFLKGSDGQS